VRAGHARATSLPGRTFVASDDGPSSPSSARRSPDAAHAAVAIEHGALWVTLDRDFARFPGLRWAPPD